jgi:hypothetical protein
MDALSTSISVFNKVPLGNGNGMATESSDTLRKLDVT